MLRFRDFLHLPQLDDLISRLLSDEPGLMKHIHSGMKQQVKQEELTRALSLPAASLPFFR